MSTFSIRRRTARRLTQIAAQLPGRGRFEGEAGHVLQGQRLPEASGRTSSMSVAKKPLVTSVSGPAGRCSPGSGQWSGLRCCRCTGSAGRYRRWPGWPAAWASGWAGSPAPRHGGRARTRAVHGRPSASRAPPAAGPRRITARTVPRSGWSPPTASRAGPAGLPDAEGVDVEPQRGLAEQLADRAREAVSLAGGAECPGRRAARIVPQMTRQHFGDGELVDVPGAVPFSVLLPGTPGPARPERSSRRYAAATYGHSGTRRRRPGGIIAGHGQPRLSPPIPPPAEN